MEVNRKLECENKRLNERHQILIERIEYTDNKIGNIYFIHNNEIGNNLVKIKNALECENSKIDGESESVQIHDERMADSLHQLNLVQHFLTEIEKIISEECSNINTLSSSEDDLQQNSISPPKLSPNIHKHIVQEHESDFRVMKFEKDRVSKSDILMKNKSTTVRRRKIQK